jgi:deoxyribonuclease V
MQFTLPTSPTQAVELQKQLRQAVRIEPLPHEPRWIAGADISYQRFSKVAHAAFIVLDAKTLRPVATSHAVAEMPFPYIPGLLSFREIPPLLEAWEKLKFTPDVLVVDGQGIAHPRRLGIASHLGLILDIPTIGCGKSRLIGRFENPGDQPGNFAPLIDRGEVIGAVLRTKLKTNPIFVSPGHRVTLEDSLRILISCVRGYRIPEPTRQAHLLVNRFRIEQQESAA